MKRLNARWSHNYAFINNIHMHYVEQTAAPDSSGVPVIFCHGFPMLWFSWHRQIPVIADAGYRVIAPSMRGMGQTEAPDEPEAYGVDEITADLLGLLDHCGIEQANYFDVFKHPPKTSYIDAMAEPPPLPWNWLSELELEYFVSEYSQSGFTGGLNWYRSMDIKWEQRKAFEGVQSQVPAWFIGSERDVDLEGFHGEDPIGLMRAIFPNLVDVQMIPKVGHMMPLEASGQLNVILLDYLSRITAP